MTDLFADQPQLKVGEGNGNFLNDLATNVSDPEMRTRWRRGYYGNIRTDYVKAWRKLAGRR